jgi:hypothetical protein
VSSANTTGCTLLLLEINGISFINKRNNIGPIMKPCGTPVEILRGLDLYFLLFTLISTLCYLPLK